MPRLTIIPSHVFTTAPGGAPGRGTLSSSAEGYERVQLQVAAKDEVEPVWYGRQRIGARIGFPVIDAVGYLLVPCYLGLGEIGGIDSVEFDNVAAPADVTRDDYTGAPGQVANTRLVNAWNLKGKSYTDAHLGKAYSVIRIPPGAEYGFNNINFVARGKKVYDPRLNAPSLAPWGSPLSASGIFGGGVTPAHQQFGTSSFTVEGWFYHNGYGSPNSFFPVSAFGTTWNVNAGWGFGAGYNANGLRVTMVDGAHFADKTLVHESGYRPSELVNTWVHVAAVVDRALARVLVYVNGVLQSDYLDLSGSPTFGSVTNTNGFNVGTAVGWSLDGRFSELRLWNVARTGDQIRAAMWSRAAGTEAGLVACYPLTTDGTDITPYATTRTFSPTPQWLRGPDIGPSPVSTLTYSDNPALCTVDMITSTAYGQGQKADWPSWAALADVHDGLVGTPPNTEKRRTIGLTLINQLKTDQWVETLRSYAGCWIVEVGGRMRAVPDEAASSVLALTSSQYRFETLSIEQVGPENSPTVVTVTYTDTTKTPWDTSATQQSKRTGVDAGTVPYRESKIPWPGCPSTGMAYREAFRRMKQAQLCDIGCRITLLDNAVRLYHGLVVTLTDAEGFSSKPFRVVDLQMDEMGRPSVGLNEYDAGVYTSEYVAGPSNPDTGFPSPNAPTAPSALVLTEELVQQQGSGLYSSRVRATWTAPVYPFILEYRVEVTLAGVVQETGTCKDTEYRSAALKEGVLYAVNVYTISLTGKASAVLQGNITLLGKDDTPSDVTGFTGREIGGKLTFGWDLVSDLDNAGYEIRYELASVALGWDSSTLLDTVPTRSARYSVDGFSAGAWRFYIKARDGKRTTAYPGGAYSTNAAHIDVTVTLDTSLFFSDRYVFTGETLENMTQYTARPDTNVYFVTNFGDTLGYGHGNTNDATGTFDDLLTKPFSVPHSAPGSPTPQSSYTSDAFDFGTLLNATWRADLLAYNQDSSGPAPSYSILVSSDGSAYTEYAGGTFVGEARFVKVRAKVSNLGTMLVVRNVTYPAVTIDTVSRTEEHPVTTSASVFATVLLDNAFTKFKTIQLTCSSAATPWYDNVALFPDTSDSFYLEGVHTSAATPYLIMLGNLTPYAYTVVDGDELWWEAYPIDGYTGGLALSFADASSTIDYALLAKAETTQLAHTGNPLHPNRQWTQRKVQILSGSPNPLLGKSVSYILPMTMENVGATGTKRCLYRNINIRDAGGTLRKALWNSGALEFHATAAANNATLSVFNTTNAFDVYAFNAAGAQVAAAVSSTFKGV